MNRAKRRRSVRKRFFWSFRIALSLVILITLALVGSIIWLVKTQDLDKLSTRLGILASIVTILIGLPTLFFTIVKWPDSESQNEHASSPPASGSIQVDNIGATNVATIQHIERQIIYQSNQTREKDINDHQHITDTIFPLWNVPYRRNPLFMGREALLARLATVLQSGQAAALSQPLAINGLGGIGKTQLAIEYAYEHRQDYQAVFWVRADTRENLISDFVAIAGELKLSEKDTHELEQTITAVQAWLNTNGGWLLILDNVDNLALAEEFIPSRYGGHLLLTTRAQATGRLAQRINVNTMPLDVGILFLLRRSGLIEPNVSIEHVSQQEREFALELMQELGGLPLALDQAGAYMEETPCGIEEYLNLYRSHRAILLSRRGGIVEDHPASVTTTLSLSFASVERVNPMAADLLRLCAFLDPDAIPEDLLRQGVTQLEPPLQILGTDNLSFHEALKTLSNYSLLHREISFHNTLNIHRLVQAVLIDSMLQETVQLWIERTTRLVIAAVPAVPAFTTWDKWERLLPHALTCVTHIQRVQIVSQEAAYLMCQTGQYLRERGQYTEAEPILKQALMLFEQSVGRGHLDRVQSYLAIALALMSLGLLYEAQGKYSEAESLYKRGLAIYEQELGPMHFYTATSLNNLARLYLEQEKYAEAEPLFQRSLAIREQQLGPMHHDTAIVLNNLARLYREQERYAEAEPLFLRGLAIREQQFEPIHPSTADSLYNLAVLYDKQGKYVEADSLYQRALAICKQKLGPNHPTTKIIEQKYSFFLQILSLHKEKK
jgi:tetratricopeptide (TPR) repeat protein